MSRIGGAGHPAVYAVIIGSGSAAIVLPVIQERRLEGPAVLTLIAQVTVADVAATIAIPFVLQPAKAGRVAAGTALIAAAVIAIYALGQVSRRIPAVHTLRHEGKKRRWAIDLRVALIALFTLAWIAQRTGASLLVAGFGAGLMIAATGGPKRLSTEVLGVAGGFFIPLFFVLLGARIDLRGIVQHPRGLEDNSRTSFAGRAGGVSSGRRYSPSDGIGRDGSTISSLTRASTMTAPSGLAITGLKSSSTISGWASTIMPIRNRISSIAARSQRGAPPVAVEQRKRLQRAQHLPRVDVGQRRDPDGDIVDQLGRCCRRRRRRAPDRSCDRGRRPRSAPLPGATSAGRRTRRGGARRA